MRFSSPRFLRSVLSSSIALAAIAFSGQALAIQDCELNSESVNLNNGNSTVGKSGLVRCKDRDSGVVQREQDLKNGVFMGVNRWFDKGKLSKERYTNERGNNHGLSREFSPDGKVLREGNYDNGTEVGLSRTFYLTGQLRRATWYANGEKAYAEFTEAGKLYGLFCGDKPYLAPTVDDAKLCGFSGGPSQVELFSGKGTVRSKVTYAAGKRTGLEELYEDGKPSYKLVIAGTERTEQRFSESGVKRREIVSLIVERGTVKLIEKEFSDSGTLTREQRWTSAGDPALDESFYLNRQPRKKTVYSGTGDTRFAEETSFSDEGKRSSTGRYNFNGRYRQTPIGVHKSFNEKGAVIAETTYDDKGRLTRERTWDGKGNLAKDDAVFEDGSRKAFAK